MKSRVELLQGFEESYKKLNTQQQEAVDAIDGPVMVVAGPGTGKTQVLTLRIANILRQTDTEASGILCLTFTRSGVTAMRERLESYIGTLARDVKIATFHSFAIELVEKYHTLLGFSHPPQLLDDNQNVLLVDELLNNGDWEYIRPRTNPTQYFHDLKQLISIMKRERLTPETFAEAIDADIKSIENDPESISSRGPTKGQLKKDAEKKIEALRRTKEVVVFYEAYEQKKKEANFMDYEDVLEFAVQLAEESDSVRADIRENYLYVLVDEHQDSSLIQNNFLKAVWADVELPNIFVVGDDRQLIYGFSGASLDYFAEFKHAFGKAQLITLKENYRSTAPVLNLADELLKSSITPEALHSNRKGDDHIILSEYRFSRDEIIGAGLYFKKLLDQGISASECALLLPKNHQVKTAVAILRDMGLPVRSMTTISLFALPESKVFMKVLELVTRPDDAAILSDLLLDSVSGIAPMDAYRFLRETKKTDQISIDDLIHYKNEEGLFQSENSIVKWGKLLEQVINETTHDTIAQKVAYIGNQLLIDRVGSHEELLKAIEIVRSFIHIAESWQTKSTDGTFAEFIDYLKRVKEYGGSVELASFEKEEGVAVMTLHKSKGLEYEHVWIGHMNEEVLMREKRNAFTLPDKIAEHMSERDLLTVKREVYVALTRAKHYATLSYAVTNETGAQLELARIIADLPKDYITQVSAVENESIIINHDPKLYALTPGVVESTDLGSDVEVFVRNNYTDLRISVTLLNNFFECPWKWYFRNFLKLPEVKGVSLALGSVVHSTIEVILKASKLPTEKEINEIIQVQLRREGVLDAKEVKRLGKNALDAVSTWIGGYYNNLAKDRVTERSVSYRDPQFSRLTMYGEIDLTERFPDGSIVVTDFKTGSSKTTGMIEKIDDEGRLSSYMRQLAMYSYLISGTEGKMVTESRLLFLEEDPKNKNALYRTHVTGESVELLVRDIRDYANLLETGRWMNRACNTPTYGSHEGCEYCKRAEIILKQKKDR